MSTNSASLRDLYIDPAAAWSFFSTQPQQPYVPQQSQCYNWSRRPVPNSIFDLSPLDPTKSSYFDGWMLFRSLVASAVLQYSSSAIVMPWETAKLLLQVQWVPRHAAQLDEQVETSFGQDDDDILSDTSNGDSYFSDPYNHSSTRVPLPRPTDLQGYVIRRSVLEEGTRPEYIIPVGSTSGVWGMIKRIVRFRGEGWLSLWKGLLTSCVIEILSSTAQPVVHAFLQSLFFPSSHPINLPPTSIIVASHLITGVMLSPLDLIRTRLIVQSFAPRYRSYSGPYDALSCILRDEGGLKGIYLHPHILIPTIIDNSLRPFVSLTLPGMLVSTFSMQISEQLNPLAWSLLEFGASFCSLLITLPFETIRRRLQVQVRGSANPLKGCVELRPAPYNGIIDAAWHIISEERSDLPIYQQKQRGDFASHKGKDRKAEASLDLLNNDIDQGSWLRSTGFGQLYRGMGMRLCASSIIFVLTMFRRDESERWAEL